MPDRPEQLPELLFVYGSLRPSLASGEPRRLVEGLASAGEATMRGLLHDLGEYPGMTDGDGVVYGELLQVTELEHLMPLDAYEECGGPNPLFRRVAAVARRADGTLARAWVYLYARPLTAERVVGGDYAAHLARRQAPPE